MHTRDWQSTLFSFRNVLAGLPLVYALFSTRWEWENEIAVWSLTIVLCAAGIALRCWACMHCNYGRSREKRLARTGPYAYVRNPLYLGNLLLIAAATVASELVWMLPITLLWGWAVYSLVAVSYEEARLVRWYGEEYRQYRDRVPAWLPFRSLILGPGDFTLGSLLVQALKLLLLLPFLLKELHWFGLG